MRLWIIGNGFDLHHGLHTNYLDYKAYLCQKNNKECGRVRAEYMQQGVCRNCSKGKIERSSCTCPVRRFNALPRKGMKEDLWCDLEKACLIDLGELLKRLDGCDMDARGEIRESEAKIRLEQDIGFAKNFTATWLARWFHDIEEKELSTKGEQDQSVDIEKEEDLFLTFNYTTTLEKIYKIPYDRILHIHGCMTQVEVKNAARRKKGVIKDKEGRVLDEGDIGRMYLVFGSSDLTDDAIDAAVDHYAETRSLNAEQIERLRHRLLILTRSLKKDVQGRLGELRTFMGRYCGDLLSLDEVVVAGHSLNRIDGPYFNYLADLFKCVKWRFVFHNEDDIKRAFEFCERYKLDGYCASWDSMARSSKGGVPSPERGGAQCPGFSVCWPSKK